MLATMESDRDGPMVDPGVLLAEAERAAAAPYVDYPPTPWWFFPGAGLWVGAMVLAIANMPERPALSVVAVLVLVMVEIGFFTWYRKRRGTSPTLRDAPVEVSRAMRRYWIGLSVVIIIGVLVAWLASVVAAAAVLAIAVTIGLVLYERDYGRQAAATRQRLG